jgi:hypothetical protein
VAVVKSAWLALKEATGEERETLLASIRAKLRTLIERVELAKQDQTVSGQICYKGGQVQSFQINLTNIKAKRGLEICIEGKINTVAENLRRV